MKTLVEAMVAVLPKSKKKPSKFDSECQRLKRQRGAQWFNTVSIDDSEMKNLMPPLASYQKDANFGRFLVHHAGVPYSRRSIAWTKRGAQNAIALALAQMWDWQKQCTGAAAVLPPEILTAAAQ